MIIGLAGKAGAGKDTVADILVKDHHFVKVSFADPMKRICRDVFAFTREQMWGPSSARNAPDERYPKGACGAYAHAANLRADGPRFDVEYLTPRHALQTLGTEWGRGCYENVWVDYAIRVAQRLEAHPELDYTAETGVRDFHGNVGHLFPRRGVVIPDVRFPNEVDAIERAGGHVLRIMRPDAGLEGAAAQHISETALDDRPLIELHNRGSLVDLRCTVGHWMEHGS